MNILLLDDDELMLNLYREMLEMGGHSVCVFKRPMEALAFLSERPPIDLILSDVKMPEMNGVDFFYNVRRNGSPIPFVFITGQSTWADQPPDTLILEKPISFNQLLTTVQRMAPRVQASQREIQREGFI